MKIKNKIIVITGASSGIGAELCRMLADNNHVVATARSTSKIPEHKNIIPYSCDVSKPENVDKLFDFVIKTFETIDLFFANAGFAYYGFMKNPDWKEATDIFNTNVFSVIYSLQKLKEIKGKEPFGFAITASAMSFMSLPGYALYGSTKFALKGFADAARYELYKGQYIHMIYPIATLTSFFEVAGAVKLPWPRQKASTVARIIIKGISKNRRHIFPSFLFRIMLFINKFIPAFAIYNYLEKKKIEKLSVTTNDNE